MFMYLVGKCGRNFEVIKSPDLLKVLQELDKKGPILVGFKIESLPPRQPDLKKKLYIKKYQDVFRMQN